MIKINKKYLIVATVAYTLSNSVFAVPPPDFIIQIASQLGSFFTIGIAVWSALFASSYQFLQVYASKYKKTFWITSLCIIFWAALLWAYMLDNYYQEKTQEIENSSWMEYSETTPKNSSNNMMLGSSAIKISDTSKKTAPPEKTEKKEEKKTESEFFKKNKNKPLLISNKDFNKIIKASDKPFILDARENLEYDIGKIPGSTHIRFADLKSGKWEKLPSEKIIYVVCWSGMRGKEVAEYLRSQWVVAQYLEKWVDGWVTFWGLWEGEVKFWNVYKKKNYQRLFTTKELRKKKNIIFVDSREPEKYKKKHISGALSIPLLYTPTESFEKVFWQVKEKSEVVVICDAYVNCFDAKLTGIELENRGVVFLGRYNKPWEF